MIPATELRIGNLVEMKEVFDQGIKTVSSIDNGHINSIHQSYVHPIPLTEEWLLKFGFRKKNKCRYEHDRLTNDVCASASFYMANVTPALQYVHQLQNLYFVMVGEELTPNLKGYDTTGDFRRK